MASRQGGLIVGALANYNSSTGSSGRASLLLNAIIRLNTINRKRGETLMCQIRSGSLRLKRGKRKRGEKPMSLS